MKRKIWGVPREILKSHYMARSKQDAVYSLPYVEPIDGKPYVRLAFFDKRAGRRKSSIYRHLRKG
jgi:hypothetical protein